MAHQTELLYATLLRPTAALVRGLSARGLKQQHGGGLKSLSIYPREGR